MVIPMRANEHQHLLSANGKTDHAFNILGTNQAIALAKREQQFYERKVRLID